MALAQIQVKPKTLPMVPGDDINHVVLKETYEIEGVGKETVELKGELITRRGMPILQPGTTRHSWETSTVVAQITKLELKGTSNLFGDVHVTLQAAVPAYAAVKAGKCAASVPVQVTMSKVGETLISAQPMQLRSDVTRVPPVGDEKTQSVAPVALVDTNGRSRGAIHSVTIGWRELREQRALMKPELLDIRVPTQPTGPVRPTRPG